jgi:hypothetical protein
LPDFSSYNTAKWPNGQKIYHHFPFQGPQKITQIGIFGLKIYLTSGNPVFASGNYPRKATSYFSAQKVWSSVCFHQKKNQSLFSLISYFLGLIVIVAFVKKRSFGFLCNYLKKLFVSDQ